MCRRVGLIHGGKASAEESFGPVAFAGVPRSWAKDLDLPGVDRDGKGDALALVAPFRAVGESLVSFVRSLELGVPVRLCVPRPPGVGRPGVEEDEGRIFSRWLYNLL